MKAHAQWLIFAVLGPAILIAASACNKGGGAGNADKGAELYASNICANCHGADRKGRPTFGPDITSLKANWKSPQDLAKYLENPSEYALGDQRLREEMSKYQMKMPTYASLSEEDRLTLARWLLK